jgi:hypothetical protein
MYKTHRCQVLNCELKGEWSQVKDKDLTPNFLGEGVVGGVEESRHRVRYLPPGRNSK